jgi:hypothetical protein
VNVGRVCLEIFRWCIDILGPDMLIYLILGLILELVGGIARRTS